MATPEQFFKKNMKWILLGVTILFISKFVQSCNRGMVITNLQNDITVLTDSLKTTSEEREQILRLQLDECKDEVTKYKHEVEIAKTRADAAEKRADAVQSTYEKTRANTTVTIENKSEKDTVSVNK